GDISGDAERLAALVSFLVRGEEDHRDFRQRLVGTQRLDELEAVEMRHVDVGNDEIGRPFEDHVAGGDRILGDLDLVARGLQMQPQQLTHAFIIIDDQDGGRHGGFGRGAGGPTRTGDLLITNQLLYQLSYTSNGTAIIRARAGFKE